MKTDTDLLDYIEHNHAWISYASDLAGTDKAWRCYVSALHFASPDSRERCEQIGFGTSARSAIENCHPVIKTCLPGT